MTEARANWYALRVRSRHEFVTRDELAKKGVDTFLPAATKLRRWKDRKKNVDFPLFPGYLFVSVAPRPEEFLKALKTRGAVNFVALEAGQPAPVAEEEIQSLRIILQCKGEFDIYPELKQGTRVSVMSGPLKGAEGVIIGKEERFVFVVNIEILGRSIGTRISAEDIEPV